MASLKILTMYVNGKPIKALYYVEPYTCETVIMSRSPYIAIREYANPESEGYDEYQGESQAIKEKWGWGEVPKEPLGYCSLKGRYMFWNTETREYGIATGYSKTTRYECRWKELPILREQAIDHARNKVSNTFNLPGEWVLEDILYEVWLKW